MRFVPALRRFNVPFFDGTMTSDFDANPVEVLAVGDAERFRVVVGRPLPFFLKKGTVTCSSVAMAGILKLIKYDHVSADQYNEQPA